MPKDLIIRVIGDTKPFERSVARSTQTAKGFETTLKKIGITAEASANTRVAASVRANARLRDEIAAYRSIASASAKGSREQVAAANLAASAEKKLARSLATTSTEARSLARSTSRFDRDFSHASRGVLAGSGVFRSLGRSIAFASGGFLAFATAGQFLRTSIDAAKEAAVTQKQLSAQFRASGQNLALYEKQIDSTVNQLSLLAGFENDELKAAFITIFRASGNVGKSLRDTGLAADIARAKHIDLAKAAQIVAKVEAGNVGILRRQGVQVGKNATVEQALAIAHAKFAGQARAGTTEQERFGAVLHNTEEIIGTGVLPTLNKYLERTSVWLTNMNESGKLQRNVNRDLRIAGEVLDDTVGAVRAITGAFGGFKKAVEALILLKTISWLRGTALGMGLVGTEATVAGGKVAALRTSLSGLGAISIAPIVIPIAIAMGEKEKSFLKGILGKAGAAGFDAIFTAAGGGVIGGPKAVFDDLFGADKKAAVAPKPHSGTGFRDFTFPDTGFDGADKKKGSQLTAKQRNTFFDNAIARLLQRGGFGTIQQQIAVLRKANSLIAARLKATKDVTRRLNLEDELLQNAAQIKSLNAQQAADALQKRQDVMSELIANLQLGLTKAQATAPFGDDIAALKALQAGIKAEIREFGNTADLAGQLFDAQEQLKAAKLSEITARQFKQLGLTATGDEITPGVPNLKKRLAQLSANIAGTTLDTPKLQSQLARFRKVLSEGLVPKDVRAKIRELMDGIADDLKNRAGNLTKFKAIDTDKFIANLGLDLTPAQVKAARAQLSRLGAGGTVPRQTATDGGFGGQTIVVQHTTKLDGKVLETSTTRHQQKRRRRNPPQKRGPHAGQ